MQRTDIYLINIIIPNVWYLYTFTYFNGIYEAKLKTYIYNSSYIACFYNSE